VFLGEYQHSIDDKGRLVLPSKFRHALSDGLVITKGQDRCLYVFAPERWAEEVERVNRLSRLDRRNRNYARSFFGSASDQELDRQGRIQIPPQLRSYAELDKEVLVMGVADRIEIWDAATWSELSVEADQLYADIEEALSGEGI
jgi:MraZ protein